MNILATIYIGLAVITLFPVGYFALTLRDLWYEGNENPLWVVLVSVLVLATIWPLTWALFIFDAFLNGFWDLRRAKKP